MIIKTIEVETNLMRKGNCYLSNTLSEPVRKVKMVIAIAAH